MTSDDECVSERIEHHLGGAHSALNAEGSKNCRSSRTLSRDAHREEVACGLYGGALRVSRGWIVEPRSARRKALRVQAASGVRCGLPL